MELFLELFLFSFYRIKLIGMAHNVFEKMLIFDIHNELYILQSRIDGFHFEKLDTKYDLNTLLDRYTYFFIGKREIVRKKKFKDKYIYDSNFFRINNNYSIHTQSRGIGREVNKYDFEVKINRIIYYR
jgi:hypothetical protein